MIDKACKEDYERLAIVWDSAVKASHNFLSESDFLSIKSQLLLYFDNVEIFAYRIGKLIVGFIGILEDKVEMLFVLNEYRGQKIGTKLLTFAIDSLHVKYVDVNEQNNLATRFYMKHGFRVYSRTLTDSDGRSYPLLKMQL